MEPFAWPAVVLILGGSFFLLFKTPIAGLLGRTKKVGKIGLETFEPPQLPAPEKPDALAEFMGTYDNPLLREQEASILAELKTRGLTSPDVAQKALVRSLAGTQILLHFERLQGLIWLSQVNLLTYLNSRPDGATMSEVQPFFEAARQQFPDFYTKYTPEQWVRFLETAFFIERRKETLYLTTAGREFLKWRIEDNRSGPYYG